MAKFSMIEVNLCPIMNCGRMSIFVTVLADSFPDVVLHPLHCQYTSDWVCVRKDQNFKIEPSLFNISPEFHLIYFMTT